MFDVGKLVSSLGLDNSEFMRGMQEAERRMQTASSTMSSNIESIGLKMEATGKKMRSVGKTMSIAITAPLTLAGGAMVKTAMDFEKSMNRVAAVSQATGDELKQLEAIAREMGATTKFSASEAAGGLNFLAMAGFSVQESITALPSTLKLASAGAMELAQAADIVSNVMQGFGLDALETGETVDILTKAFTSSNTSLEQLGEAMSYAAPMAKAFGQDLSTATAAVGFLSDAGIQGSRAGTGLSQSLLQLSKNAEKLGIEVTDSAGNMLNLVEILENVEEAGISTGEVIQVLGARAGPAFATLMGRGSAALREFTSELNNAQGIADEVADIQMRGLAGALTELRSATAELSIAMMQDFLPILENLARRIRELVNWFSSLDDRTRKWIVVVGAALAVAGPLLIITGQMVIAVGALTKAFAASTTVVKLMTIAKAAASRAMLALNAAFLANPIGVVIAAVAALGAALYAVNRAMSRTKQATDALSIANEKTAETYAEETRELRRLLNVIEDSEQPLFRRKEAMERLAEIMPGYNAQLTQEGKLIGHNTDQINDYLKAQENRIRMAVFEEMITEAYRKEYEAQVNYQRRLAEYMEKGREAEARRSDYARKQYMEAILFRENLEKDQRNFAISIQDSVEVTKEAVEEVGSSVQKMASNVQASLFDVGEGIFDNLIEELGRVDAVFTQLDDTLSFIDIKGNMVDDFDVISAKIRTTESALNDMIEMVVRGEGDMAYVEYLADQLRELQEEARRAKEALEFEYVVEAMSEQFMRLREVGALLGEEHLKIADEFGQYLQMLKTAMGEGLSLTDSYVVELLENLRRLSDEFENLSSSMQRWRDFGVDSASVFGQAMAQIVGDSSRTTKEIIGDMLRQVTAMLIRNIVASVPFPASLLAAAGAPLIAEGLFQAIGMREGGRVPPGYPGDSYPAMLTSGETVLPPEKLDSVLKGLETQMRLITFSAISYMMRISETVSKRPQLGPVEVNYSARTSTSSDRKIQVVGSIEGEVINLSSARAQQRFDIVE